MKCECIGCSNIAEYEYNCHTLNHLYIAISLCKKHYLENFNSKMSKEFEKRVLSQAPLAPSVKI